MPRGEVDVVSSVVRLLSLLARHVAAGPELSCEGLASSLALSLASQLQQVPAVAYSHYGVLL